MISIIIPAFNEEKNLIELHQRLVSVFAKIPTQSFEIIFIDDASTDNTPGILKGICQKDKRVWFIRFARNGGSHAALSWGLNACRGDAAIVMAAALQDPPEIINDMLNKWKDGAKIVWGIRSKREGEGVCTKICSQFYYGIVNALTNVKLPPMGADVFLADRVVVERFREVKEKHTSVFMVLAWLGFKQSSFEYVKQSRHTGISKWTLRKKIKLALDSILAFSDFPVRAISFSGIFTVLLGLFCALRLLLNYFSGHSVEGWACVIAVVLIVGGVQMIMFGILGEYLWRTFDESRQRPRYVIEYKYPSEKELSL